MLILRTGESLDFKTGSFNKSLKSLGSLENYVRPREGGAGRKRTRGEVKPICTFSLWKNLHDFSNSRVLSCKFLGSCKRFFCFEPSPAQKVFRRRYFFHLTFFYEHIIFFVIVYINVSKTLTFYVEFTKNFILFSLFTTRFFIRRFISIAELFSERESRGRGSSLKGTYLEGGYMQNKQRRTREERGQKLEVLSEHSFWMTPLLFRHRIVKSLKSLSWLCSKRWSKTASGLHHSTRFPVKCGITKCSADLTLTYRPVLPYQVTLQLPHEHL